MDNELMVSQKNMVALLSQEAGLSEAIKPLSREIFLFDSYIAGTTHIEDESILSEIKEGTKVIMRREDNRFDDNAILILDEKQRKLGYVPEKDNVVFARLMDAGKLLIGKVNKHVMKGSFHQIAIGIYLVDF
ncbi:MAG: HIRAN domain-containing protein [Lachnospiraceae bacterium]|nr:HIRAN domain-containing protein [Lachnospiraceae bacterium]